jgi:hypothetical protein
MTRQKPYSERFEDCISPEPNSGCWLWNGAGVPNKWGYCRIKSDGKKLQMVHRVAYEFHRGPIPAGLFVCHRCDVPICVNPDHLFLGTNADNVADKVRKERQVRGVKSSKAKLSPEQVLEIRASIAGARALGRQYGITHTTVGQIRQHKSWKHLSQNP